MVEKFKEYWMKHKSFISLELSDKEIQKFLDRTETTFGTPRIEHAVDWASDYLLSQGLAEVQE